MTAKSTDRKQDRSRKTLAKLLDATVRMLEEHGLDGCTMPRISAATGISAAAVYRHFEDKNALLRAAFVHAALPHAVQPAPPKVDLRGATLEATADKVIATLLAESQGESRMQTALTQFLKGAPDATLARQAQDFRKARFQSLTDAVLTHHDRIRHPEPERAAMFAVLAAAASIEAATSFSAVLPLAPKQFSAELSRAFVAYLRRKP